MSVREYIGARYLPLFPDDPQWSSANTYEPLTVVQNLGSSYISRQYVPAGIQISNTDYWVLWADFNSQIEQYRAEVQAFDGRITANANDIDALEAILPKSSFSSTNTVAAAISTNANDIDALEVRLPKSAFTSTNTVSAAINANKSAIEDLEDATVRDYAVFIGDSYLRGTGSTDGAAGGEGYSSIGNGWGKTLAAREGLDVAKVMCIAGGGGGFNSLGVNGGGNGLNYSGMVQKAYDLMTADQRARVRYVIICGGLNDGTSITRGSVSGTINLARTLFNHVPIHVFSECGRDSFPWRPTTGNHYAYGMIKEMCAGFGATYHEMWPLFYGSNGFFNSDGVHLNSEGYAVLGRAMFAALHGGIVAPQSIEQYGYVDITPSTGASFNTPLYYDGYLHVEIQGTITVTADLDISGQSPVQLGTIPQALAPRFTIQDVAWCAGENAGRFFLLPIEITNAGVIRARRAFSVATNTSVTQQPIETYYNLLNGTTIYLPVFSYDLH